MYYYNRILVYGSDIGPSANNKAVLFTVKNYWNNSTIKRSQ